MKQDENLIGSEGREQWGSRFGFIMAAAGSAIGLGNIWKFPYIAGNNGGGAFVLVYLVILFSIAVPVLLAEMTIGRHGQKNPVGAFKALAKNQSWKWVGAIGVISGFLILAFYSVVAGWTLSYIAKSVTGSLVGLDPKELEGSFVAVLTGSFEPIFWHLVVMVSTVAIVIGGVQAGIERWSKILMPALFVIIILLVLRSVTLEGAMAGVSFYLKPDFSELTGKGILEALGHSFFTLSLGMGTMITYGSYLSKKEKLPQAVASVALMDTGIALLAGLAIFPAVFAFGLAPDKGPGLVFITLPAVFNQMPLGQLFSSLFFGLLAVAALTSAISMLEVVVAYFVDEQKWSRMKASIFSGAVIFVLGVPAAMANGPLAEFTIFGRNYFDFLDYITATIMLPLGGLLTCIFLGYVWGADKALKEVTNDNTIQFKLASVWIGLLKYLAPVGIILVLAKGLGIFD